MTDKRKIWIDLVRGFCMLAILVHHTEMYYVGEAIIDYRFFADNALCTFFFISGYLFYKETPFNLKYKLLSILKTKNHYHTLFYLHVCHCSSKGIGSWKICLYQ